MQYCTNEDGSCEICLTLEGVPDFLGLSVTFGFDPEILLPTAVVAGPALVDAGCNYFLDWVNSGDFVDSVEIDTALLGCSAAMDGPLICITFQGMEFGDSPLTWLEVDVRDSDNEVVLVNTFDGMVMYSPAVANLPTSFGSLKAIYRN